MGFRDIDPTQGHFRVSCDACRKDLYDVVQLSTRALRTGEMLIQPVCITVAHKLALVFCSRGCAVTWMQTTDDRSLLGGYPLTPGQTAREINIDRKTRARF